MGIAIFYGELALIFGCIIYVYVRMYLFLASGARLNVDAKVFLAKVVFFPPVLIVHQFFGLFRYVFEVTVGETTYWLAMMDVFFSSLLGFVNAVLFCFVNSDLRKDLLGFVSSLDSRPGSSYVSRPGRSSENEIDTGRIVSEANTKNEAVEMHNIH